jgi:hypothetical protein
MASPTSSLATLRPDLAESFEAIDIEAEKAGYIGMQVFPVIDVASQAGNFGKIPLDQLLQNRDTKRAPGSGYARGNFTFTPASYATEEHGAEEPVDEREARMYAEYFDAELISTRRAMHAVLKNAEQRIADAVFNTTTWTGASLYTDITTPWTTVATATPLVDVDAAVNKVYDNSGLWPNALIINRKVFRTLRNVREIIERIESSGAGSSSLAENITARMLATAFDLDYVIVAGGSKNTADEGQTAAVGQLWSSSYAMVCKIAVSNDFREPCIGRTFHWGGDGSDVEGIIETYREEQSRSDIVRFRHDVDEVLLYKEAGHLLKID